MVQEAEEYAEQDKAVCFHRCTNHSLPKSVSEFALAACIYMQKCSVLDSLSPAALLTSAVATPSLSQACPGTCC